MNSCIVILVSAWVESRFQLSYGKNKMHSLSFWKIKLINEFFYSLKNLEMSYKLLSNILLIASLVKIL